MGTQQHQGDKLIQYGEATLQKSSILRCNANFLRVKNEGKYLSGRNMVIGVYTDPAISFQVGFITSKKVEKRAVYRNRAKRMLRESLRLSKAKINQNTWLVIIGKRSILKCDTVAVQKEMIYLLKKAGVWID